MQPIVDGLEEQYGAEITFVYLNAADDDVGQSAFESLGLPGHPSYVIFSVDGTEQYRAFGLVDEAQLAQAIESLAAD